jgi:hypothetical protein
MKTAQVTPFPKGMADPGLAPGSFDYNNRFNGLVLNLSWLLLFRFVIHVSRPGGAPGGQLSHGRPELLDCVGRIFVGSVGGVRETSLRSSNPGGLSGRARMLFAGVGKKRGLSRRNFNHSLGSPRVFHLRTPKIGFRRAFSRLFFSVYDEIPARRG